MPGGGLGTLVQFTRVFRIFKNSSQPARLIVWLIAMGLVKMNECGINIAARRLGIPVASDIVIETLGKNIMRYSQTTKAIHGYDEMYADCRPSNQTIITIPVPSNPLKTETSISHLALWFK